MMTTLAGIDDNVTMMAVGGGILIAIVSVVFHATRKMVQTTARERTKREVAAYVAEGTMTPDQAQQILQADMPKWEKDCCGKKG